jgi:hypothetical protein
MAAKEQITGFSKLIMPEKLWEPKKAEYILSLKLLLLWKTNFKLSKIYFMARNNYY